MREILKDAIDSEPIFKYSLILIKWILLIGFNIVWGVFLSIWNVFIVVLQYENPNIDEEEKHSEWLRRCAMQEQWERDHA